MFFTNSILHSRLIRRIRNHYRRCPSRRSGLHPWRALELAPAAELLEDRTLLSGAAEWSSPAAEDVSAAAALMRSLAEEHHAHSGGHSSHAEAHFRNLKQVGQHDLGGGGFHTDVWAHGEFAYVGTWGAFEVHCPATGTKVIDISDPADPVQVGTLPTVPNTQTNDIKVANINTEFFHGDLLVVTNESCDVDPDGGGRGIELWDVSDPLNPEFLSRLGPEAAFDTPEFWDQIGFGVHNTWLFQQGDRAYVLAVLDFREILQTEVGLPATGDLLVIDVTDPRNPMEVASWGIKQDLGLKTGFMILNPADLEGDPLFQLGEDCRPDGCRGPHVASNFLHDVWANPQGTVAYLSYWDAGLILLDISDPASPSFIGRGTTPLTEEGETHAAVPARGGNLVITTDEDFFPDPWGFMRIFDTSDPANPVEIGRFQTENSDSDRTDSFFSAHNIFVRGNTAYLSWYADGLRVVDFSDPIAPKEVAFFVPPDVSDPNGILPATGLFWGVYVDQDLILASDINGGLYILKYVPGAAGGSATSTSTSAQPHVGPGATWNSALKAFFVPPEHTVLAPGVSDSQGAAASQSNPSAGASGGDSFLVLAVDQSLENTPANDDAAPQVPIANAASTPPVDSDDSAEIDADGTADEAEYAPLPVDDGEDAAADELFADLESGLVGELLAV